MRTFARLAAAGLLTVGLVLAAAAPAWAHAEVVGSVPADGATVAGAPAELVVDLSEPVELRYTKVSVVDGDGHPFPAGAATFGGVMPKPEEPVALHVPLPPLPPGTYRVSWSTLSSDDLHQTAGTLLFGVQRQLHEAAAVPADPLPRADETLAQWLGYLGFGGWLGAVVLALLVARRGAGTDPVYRGLMRCAAGSAVLAVVAGIALLLVRASGLPGGAFAVAWQLVTTTSAGPPWLVKEGAATGMVVAAVLGHRKRRAGPVLAGVAVLLGGAAAASTALLGHLANAGPVWLVVDSVHVLATMTWAGSVLAAAVALLPLRGADRRAATGVVLRRFGVIALAALTVLAATGFLLAGDRVASVDALLLSTYGRVLLVKLGFVAVAALAGLATTIGLHRHRQGRRTGRRSWIAVEAVALGAALVATAAVTASHQATGARWTGTAAPAAPPVASADVGDLVETISVRPNAPGRNFITVRVFDARRPSPGPVQSVLVHLTGPAGARVDAVATRASADTFLLTAELGSPGDWQIGVDVDRAGLAPTTHGFDWALPQRPVVPVPVVVSHQPLDRYTGWLALAALVAGSAAGLTAAAITARRRRASAGDVPVSASERGSVAGDLVGSGQGPG